ncbi:hypothetical protein TrVFT333_006187 [Trichoderma virens FT-333]|nr:hypothetical protein TrVFT333_006187 [Trichoderma virens FT-333]
MAIQLQWGLEQMGFSGLRAARDLIHAASTDNIQAKAIQACEGFGATLAICPETRRKIELTVVPTPPSIPVSFFNSFIGYSPGDCISQLSKSLAGLQFLGLAAALITTIPMSQAGDLVSAMLANSASDKTLVPSRRQTIDLLKSIEGRCYHAGFAEDCMGWELLLRKTIGQAPSRNLGPNSTSALPAIDGVESLVDAFRQLHRVGETHITRLTIQTSSAAPWTIAFVKWCLGRPPSVVLEDGTCILSQEESLVEVLVSQDDPSIFQVHLHSSIPSLSTLIETKVSHETVGMVRVSCFGKLLLRGLRGGDFATKVLAQLVPLCIRQITQHLVVLGDNMAFGNAAIPQQAEEFHIVDVDLHKQRLSPFPDEEVIIEACEDLLSQKYPGILYS